VRRGKDLKFSHFYNGRITGHYISIWHPTDRTSAAALHELLFTVSTTMIYCTLSLNLNERTAMEQCFGPL